MQAQIKLGRVFGVDLGLHYSWLIIAMLITVSLAAHFNSTNAEWGPALIWGMAIVTGGLFFTSIVAHELAHASVAKARGLPVRSITLFALGGVAQVEKEATDPRTEFKMAIAGPIASVVIGASCLALAYVAGWPLFSTPATPLSAMLVWLGYINVMLAIFNMIPGFPLDGGRVLRAAIWWTTNDANRATRTAARVGQVVAYLFIVVGVVQFAGGGGLSGLWIAFIGWFLLDAARASYAEVEITRLLRGVTVGDVMTQGLETIGGNLNLQTFADEHLFRSGRRCYAVVENGALLGLITPHEVKEADRSRWPYTVIFEAMIPLERLHTVRPDTALSKALETMSRNDVNQLPVLIGSRLAGVVTRGDILGFLQTRNEFSR